MRIFLAIPHSPNSVHIPESSLWLKNLYLPLLELGHEVALFEYDYQRLIDVGDDEALSRQHRPKLCEALTEQLSQAHRQKPVQLFFSYFYDSCITPEAIQRIRQMGIMTVNFSCNNVHQFHLVKRLAAWYDYCMVPEQAALEKFRLAGGTPVHIQLGANPAVYRPYPLAREFDVTFVGQKYVDRPDAIYHLLKHGVEIKVWGAGWHDPEGLLSIPSLARGDLNDLITKLASPRQVYSFVQSKAVRLKNLRRDQALARVCFPPLADEELIRTYSRSTISLGFSKVVDPEHPSKFLRHIRLRDFEAPMSGAFYLVEYHPELEAYYKIGREIVCFSNRDELLDKVRYYLAHPDEVERIRRAGHERAVRDHTWTKRFHKLFSEIKLN